MLLGSIVTDLLAAFGCFTLSVLLVIVTAVVAAAKAGYLPGVARLMDKLTAKPGGDAK